MSFPIITTYDHLLTLIAEKPAFVVRHNEDLNTITIGYKVLSGDNFQGKTELESALLRECRGIIFDKDSKQVISRRLHKFSNLNESEDSQFYNIDFSRPHWIMDKLDGSMYSFIKYNNKYYAMSKMGYTEHSEIVQPFTLLDNYKNFLDVCSENNWTATFEYISPSNHIVIHYDQDELILTAIRDNITGNYVFNPDQMTEFAKKFDIPVVKSYKAVNLTNKDIEKLKSEVGKEGFIIRFENGDMIKVKTKYYLDRHRSFVSDSVIYRKDAVKIILEDTIDDIIPELQPRYQHALIKFRYEFVTEVENVVQNIFKYAQYLQSLQLATKKNYVMAIQNGEYQWMKYILLPLYNNVTKENIEKAIHKMIMNATKTEKALNNIEFLFNGVTYKP